MTAYDSADWPKILQAVALALLGDPAQQRRGEWRYGRRGSLVVHVDGDRAGTWYDFEAGYGGGVVDMLRHIQGLEKPQAVEWLRARGHFAWDSPANTWNRDHREQRAKRSSPDSDTTKRLRWARSWWNIAVPIPISPDHPARRWLGHRQLWRSGIPLPAAVRWAPATGSHNGAGSIVAMAARPEAWLAAWPKLPPVAAVHLVHVDLDGRPALDRPAANGGLSKRSIGSMRGAVVILGNPRLPESIGPAHIAEGLADALALASRHEGTATAVLGTSGMTDPLLAKWLATSSAGVKIHCDTDQAKGGHPPAGRRAAATLLQAVKAAGGQAQIVPPLQGFKDAAEEAAAGPGFSPLPEAWIDCAKTLVETTDWPRWEVARVATIMPQEPNHDQ